MTTIASSYRLGDGGRLLYEQRESVSAAAAFVLLALLLVGFSQPVAEQIVRFKERIISVEVSREALPAEPAKPSYIAPAPFTPPPLRQAQPRAEPKPQATLPLPAAPQSPEAVAKPLARPLASLAAAQLATPPAAVPKLAAPPTAAAPARPTTPPAPSSPAGQTDRYEAQILRYLESVKRYPSGREARQTRPKGIVTVWFELARNGKVIDAGIEKSSNSSLLDSEALKTVRSGNFPVFPDGVHPDADKHRFAAHLSYELKTSD